MDAPDCGSPKSESTANFRGNASEQSLSPESDSQWLLNEKQKHIGWYFMDRFTVVGGHDGIDKCICMECGKECMVNFSKYGISTLKRHLLICEKQSEYGYVGDLSDDHGGIDNGYFRHMITLALIHHDLPFCFVEYEHLRDLISYLKVQFEISSRDDTIRDACEFYVARARGIDYGYVRHLITMAIIHHDLPFSFVEYEKLRELWHYLNPDFKFINKDTAVADVRKFYVAHKEELKLALARIPSRVCLTADIWSTFNGQGYFCLAAHYVDEDWKSNNKILSICFTYYPHSDEEFAEKILSCLKHWGIEKKIFSLTLDNFSADDNIDNILKRQLCLQDNLLCGGDFFQVKSCATILDFIVQEALKLVGDVLIKIRESIMYVKGSEERTKLFLDFVQQAGIQSGVALCLDMANQWVSTYTMLHGAVTYRAAFDNLQSLDEDYKPYPSHADWSSVEKVIKFLEPFYGVAKLISGSSCTTSNIYFMEVWRIGCFLKENLDSEDEVIKEMASKMQIKFIEYWDQYNVILGMGATFDPRMKFEMLEFCYGKLDPSTCREKLDSVKRNLYLLFEQYKSRSMATESSSQSSIENNKGLSALDVLIEYENKQNNNKDGKSLLDMYLEDDARLPMKYNYSMDVLNYWRDHSKQYGVLACMACDLLSIPATTAASESSFSIGACAFKKYRSRLLPTSTRAKICARNWLLGYVVPEDDDKEYEVVLVPPSISEPNANTSDMDTDLWGGSRQESKNRKRMRTEQEKSNE